MRRVMGIIIVAVAALTAWTAAAQERFPTRGVKFVVPYTAGTATDIAARLIAQRLQERWGTSVIVENQPGANGQIGAHAVVRSQPDGYTLLVIGESVFTPYGSDKPLYDPEKDLVPVVRLAGLPMAFFTRKNFPATTWAEFVAYVRANPDKVSFSTPGAQGAHHIFIEGIIRELGLKMYHVPAKTAAAAVQDVLGGQIDVTLSTASMVPPLRPLGIHVLAAGGPKRSSALTDTPSFTELGVKSMFESDSWAGVLAPSGTPPAVVRTIAAAVDAVVKDPTVAAEMAKLGLVVAGGTPEEYAAVYARTGARQKPILQDWLNGK